MDETKEIETWIEQNREWLPIKHLLSKIRELKGELQREEQVHVMSVYDFNIKIAGLEIRIWKLEKGIEKWLCGNWDGNDDAIYFKKLIEKKP